MRILGQKLHLWGNAVSATPQYLGGFREFCSGAPSKRALVSYLVGPLLPPPAERDRVMFSNKGIAQEIPRSLNELGYEVDIVQWDDLNWRPSSRYDLFVGHGGVNFENVSHCLSAGTVQIYLSTGIYWKQCNRQEAKRLYDLAERRGYLLAPDQPICHSEEYANRVADGIICLGNINAAKTYKDFAPVSSIRNAVYPIAWRGLSKKAHERGRTHYLFFNGGGNVHKGLDLLLEAFSGTDLHLHVCQHISPQFAAAYGKELNEPNIHVYGHISMRSVQFETLAATCNWAISATCAEGQPGSILECMGYGMIPILPDAANIDLNDFGIRLEDCSVETIRTTLLAASQMPPEECKRRAQQAAAVIAADYTVEGFRSSFKSAVNEVAQLTHSDSRYLMQ